jgi:sigma-B regulation protein RsbU (phosphoserine phosphatase)
MAEMHTMRILLVEDNRDFAKLVEVFLRKYELGQFEIVWKENGQEALAEFDKGEPFDVVLMDYFLPGQNGLEVTRALQERRRDIPVVFLTVNKDFDLAVELMKMGVEDYLVKEEVSTPVLPKTLLNVIERRKLREQLTALEVSQKRLEAIQGLIVRISQDVRLPLNDMRKTIDTLVAAHGTSNLKTYLTIINDNLSRIEKKIIQLKELKTDKTVTYVKDIRMFDLSE